MDVEMIKKKRNEERELDESGRGENTPGQEI